MNTTISSFSMKTLLNMLVGFVRKQWFLIIMLATIALIVMLFEMI
jgi:hypothetical protein